MVQVGLTGPYRAGRTVVGIEFVVPTAAFKIDEMLGDEVPAAPIPLLEARLPRALQQGCCACAGFGVNPMQPGAYPWLIIPAEGVDEARLAIDAPRLCAGGVEQGAGTVDQPWRGLEPAARQAGLQMKQKPRHSKACPGVVP